MQVKIFEAPDMTTGLKRIREELGPDALILSTRTRRDGPLGLLGTPVVEITAAIDSSPLGGNAVTMAERNILTGGNPMMKDMPASPSARRQTNAPTAGKRIDFTVGADGDLLADLQPSEKSAMRTAKPSPAKNRGQDTPQDATMTPPEPKPTDADARRQILAPPAKDDAANVLINKERKSQETTKPPKERPSTPKAKTGIKKRGGAAAARPSNEPAVEKKNGRTVQKHDGIAAPVAAPHPEVDTKPRKPSLHKLPAHKPAIRPADVLTGPDRESLLKIGERSIKAPPPNILAYLKNCGIEPEAAQALACHAGRLLSPAQLNNPQAVRRCLVEAVENFISVAPPDFTDGGGQRRIALVGPTGVGKTTTIAKLAAWYLAHQYGKLALITIDTYRIAAVEQLKVYGEIMRLPVEVVMNPEQLAARLQKHRDAALILIDTSGHSPQNAEMVTALAEFFIACPPIEKHLVLSATTRENELLHSLKAFQPLDVERTIFTKTDECSNLGVLLNVQLHNAQPLSFLTNGQRVPEDLLEIDRRSVAELILSEGAARHA